MTPEQRDPSGRPVDLDKLRGEFARIGATWLRLALAYGVARIVASLAVCLAVLFVLDRMLALPTPLRLVFLAGGLFGLVHLVRRGILYPLRKRPSPRDVACAIERKYPQFDGRLLSVLELEGDAIDPQRNVSVELVDQMRRETALLRDATPIEGIFEYRHLKRIAVAAALFVAADLVFVALQPELASIFLRRAFGSDARWPQRTLLAVAFPEHGTHFAVDEADGRPVRVRIARGASLPVAVTVEGENPESVDLVAEDREGDASRVALSSTAERDWAGRFRSVREPFRFRPVGGDDDGEGREVEVEIFAPPAVSNVVTELAFPAYTGLEKRREPRGDVEAPIGTQVTLEVTTPEPVAGGRLIFDSGLPALALDRVDGAPSPTLRATFGVAQSCAYSIELVGDTGFKNLEPPTYAVLAIKDRSPTVRVIEPARGDIDVTPDGVVALRVAADDDYGLTELFAEIKPFGAEKARTLGFGAVPAPADSRRRLVYEQFDLKQQTFDRANGVGSMSPGESLVYRVVARDNYAPPAGATAPTPPPAPDSTEGATGAESAPKPVSGPNETAIVERRIDIVSASEKLRLLTEKQIRTKEEVKALRVLQLEKIERLDAILKEFDQSEGVASVGPDDIAALEVGQNQVTTRTLKQCREFSDNVEEYLLNRLDHSSGAEGLIVVLQERKRASTLIDGFDVRLWRPLVDSNAAGAFGRLDVLGRLFEMLDCVIDVADEHSPAAAKALSEARVAVDADARPAALRTALSAEQHVLERLDVLLAKLDEWENYQEILGDFRALIDDQRELNQRTRRSLK